MPPYQNRTIHPPMNEGAFRAVLVNALLKRFIRQGDPEREIESTNTHATAKWAMFESSSSPKD